MTGNARWLTQDRTAILIELVPSAGWTDFHESIRKAHALAREVRHPVSIIIEPYGKLPQGNALTQFRMAFSNQPENLHKVFIIVPSDPGSRAMVSFVKRLSAIIHEVYRSKSETIFVNSIEEAIEQVLQPVHE
ncbi:MAG TPA: hypothetical protein VK003_12085 [Oceanobacillus sp.]|nr:hypothetical protein [Oceanobacillus sp.]